MEKLTAEQIEERGLTDLGNGHLLDPETGEVIVNDGVFTVHDDKSAEWVLRKLQEYDSEILATSTLLSARVRDLEHELAKTIKSRRWFAQRYEVELRTHAEQQLKLAAGDGNKPASTWKCQFGFLKFSKTFKKVVVADVEKAIAYLKATGRLDAIKVEETVLLKPLADIMDDLPKAAFTIIPEGKNCAIDTGIDTGVKL